MNDLEAGIILLNEQKLSWGHVLSKSYTQRISGSTFGLPSSLLSLHMRLPILSVRRAFIFFVQDSCRCFPQDGLLRFPYSIES